MTKTYPNGWTLIKRDPSPSNLVAALQKKFIAQLADDREAIDWRCECLSEPVPYGGA